VTVHSPGPHGDDLADEFLELTYGLMRDLRRDASEAPGLTTPGQVRLLRALRRADEPRRPGELAVDLDVAARSITAKVDQAEQDGLVRRLPDPTDRRATLVELTDAGRAVLDAVASARHEGAAARLDRLTPDEQARLVALLRRVRGL
jgi:DNA-binding MarR family transcriptional regulator